MSEFVVPEYRVSTDRLRAGVCIRLEGLKWHEHPFLFKTFKITGHNQIQTLHDLGIKEVICIPGKSDCLPLGEMAPQEAPQEAEAEGTSTDELWRIKRERTERLHQQQETILQREKNYLASQERVSTIMSGIASAVPSAIEDAAEFADAFSRHFLEDAETTLHLMQFTAQDEGMYYHAMNVAVLSMMLGKMVGVGQEEMKALCQGALFHDIGKSKIDRKVLLKEGRLNRAELDYLRMHPKYGFDILAPSESFPRLALLVVYQHHECVDGSGYPKGIKGLQIHLLSKLVAIADVYDNHCNKRNPAESLTPYEALSYMFSRQKTALDEKLLSSFIRCLGIYPPGTVVQLNNGAIGMVIAVDPENQLQPSIVMYDPEIPVKDALIIDMQQEHDLKITQSIRPAALPEEIFNYLSPRRYITYFVDATNPSPQKGRPR
jgi:putative nucleotidyltransferase with HDIG domain